MINKIKKDIHLKEILKGSSIAFILRIVGIIAGYIFTLIITRNYGAEAMGIFALSLTLFQISSVLSRLGMDTALLRFAAEYSSQGKWNIVIDIYKKALKLVVPFSLIISVLIFVFSPYIAEYFFKKPYLASYFQLISIGILPLVLLYIHAEGLRGLKKIKEYMLLQQTGIFVIASLLQGLITVLYLSGKVLIAPAKTPIVSYIISVFLLSITAYFVWRKYIKPYFHSARNISQSPSYKYILSVSIPMLFSSSLALIMGWTDTIVLGIFRAEEEVGVYNVIIRIASILILPLTAINAIVAPKISGYYWNNEKILLYKLMQISSKLNLVFSSLIFFILMIFGENILKFFGETFVRGNFSLIILLFGYFFNSYFGNVGAFLNMTGNQRVLQNIILLSIIINVILNFLLIPSYGILGASISTSFSMFIWNLLGAIFVKQKFNILTFYIPKI
ncbi:MAG: flippase [Aquificae bacterium]|nr:flippase [Aquificota bacterium]